MDELKCRASHKRAGTVHVKESCCLHHKERAQALSPIQRRVAHRSKQPRRPCRLVAQCRRTQEPIEQCFNVACSCGETVGKAGSIVFHRGIDSGYSRFRKVGSIAEIE